LPRLLAAQKAAGTQKYIIYKYNEETAQTQTVVSILNEIKKYLLLL
jgi:hypothetical protein